MIKKRNGSSMVTVLGVTLVLVFLSGIILSLTMGTMKSNVNQKEKEDVQFAAESGLEIGKSYLNNIASQIPPTGDDGKPIMPSYVFDTEVGTGQAHLPLELEKGNIKDVKIKSESLTNGRVKLTSEAIDLNNRNKKISCELDIFQKNENHIFDYGLVAGQGQIDLDIFGGGKSDITSKYPDKNIVSSGNGSNNIPPNIVNGKPQEVGIDKNKFGNLNFLENKTKSKKIDVKFPRGAHTLLKTAEFVEDGAKISPTIIKVDILKPTEYDIDGKIKDKANLKKEDIKNAVIMEIKLDNTATLEMLITNTQELELITSETQLHLINKVLLNGGVIKFSGTGSIDLYESTLYSEDIVADLELAFKIHGSLGDKFGSDSAEKTINEIISGILPGWNDTTNVTVGGISVSEGTYGED